MCLTQAIDTQAKPHSAQAGQTGQAGQAGQPKQASEPLVTMRDVVEATLRTNRGIKTLQENRDVVNNELTRAKAGWGPRVDLTGRAGGSQLSDSTTRNLDINKKPYGAGNVSLMLTQPLWDGNATRSRVRTAEATVQSVLERVIDNATSLSLDGIISQVNINHRRTMLHLAENNVARHQQILAATRARQNQGAASLGEVSQTEGRLARAKSTVAEAKDALREAENTFRRVTGLPVPANLATVELPEAMYESPGAALEQARTHNPKIRAYQQDIKAASGGVGLARSAYYPTFNIEAGPAYSSRGGGGSQWVESMEVMGTVRWNLYNSGADKAEEQAARARVRQSRQAMFDFADSLDLELRNSWSAYIAAQEQYTHYKNAIRFNTTTRNTYLEQFTLGQRSLLDVLDAESELFNSSTQAVTAQGNILINGWRMAALSGQLLSRLGVDTEALSLATPERGGDEYPAE